MNLDLDKLEQVARDATPGPWVATKEFANRWGVSPSPEDYYPVASVYGQGDLANIEANAAYISAANPAVVLEIVRRLRAAEAENAELRTRPSGEQIGIIAVKLIRENATDDSDDEFLAGRACGIGHLHTELLKHMIAAQGASHG